MPDSTDLPDRVDVMAATLGTHLQTSFGFLQEEARRRPPCHRDVADVEVAMTRLVRAHQLLEASRVLARNSMGTAIAPVVRALWETWINTAWMLQDPAKRPERAGRYYAAGVAQALGRFDMFLRRDKHLILRLRSQQALLRKIVRQEPQFYAEWCNPNGDLTKSPHSIRTMEASWSDRCRLMDTVAGGTLYMDSYDVDYYLLSLIDHGEGEELSQLISEGDFGKTHVHAAGRYEAVDHLITACGCALMVVYELERAYRGRVSIITNTLRGQIESLRHEFGSVTES